MSTSRPTTSVTIIGTGYVGMASAIGLAQLHMNVVGYDISSERVRLLQRGITPYREAGITELLETHLASGRTRFVESFPEAVGEADFIVIAVGTPSRDDGSADMSAVDQVVERLAATPLKPRCTVVIRSTVPAGTTDRIADRLSGRATVLFAPEFLREGSAIYDFLNPDRIVIGTRSEAAAEQYGALFEQLRKPIFTTTYRNAELIKCFSNAFLAMKISFANEVASMCDALDADALHVLHGVGQDRRIGEQFLAPGIGFGGPCFEKDVKALLHMAQLTNSGSELLSATLNVNTTQPRRVVDVLEGELGTLKGAHIGVWGLTFKAGTDDVRDSVAMRVIDDLHERGASVIAYDPAIAQAPAGFQGVLAASPLEAANTDALLILTEWPQFRDIDPRALAARLRRKVIVDGRNILDPEAVTATGLRYRGVGRRSMATAEELAEAI